MLTRFPAGTLKFWITITSTTNSNPPLYSLAHPWFLVYLLPISSFKLYLLGADHCFLFQFCRLLLGVDALRIGCVLLRGRDGDGGW